MGSEKPLHVSQNKCKVKTARAPKKLLIVTAMGLVPVVRHDRPMYIRCTDILETYVGKPYPTRFWVYEPDPEYVEMLRDPGYSLEPLTEDTWLVKRDKTILGQYPPYGCYDDHFNEIYVLKSKSQDIGIIVHEAVHYHINNISKNNNDFNHLKVYEESVARIIEKWASSRYPPLKPIDIINALKNKHVLKNVNAVLKAHCIEVTEIATKNPSNRTQSH